MMRRALAALASQLILTAALLLIPSTSFGQSSAARPDRGAVSGASYAVSDMENVSLTNGNMSLSISLAGLPPVAGGKLSLGVSASYNSKQWDTVRSERQSDPIDPTTKYTVSNLQLSGAGGWRIGGAYEISFQDITWDYDWMAPPPNDPEYNLLTGNRWTKVVLTTPDGATHELRPLDYSPYADGFQRHPYLRGYYKDNPNSVNSSMRYYSFDGSHIWARLDPDPYLFSGSASSWTIHLPDGTKIAQAGGVQRITDTNGNSVKVWSDTAATHYQDELTGREVRVVYNASGNGGQGAYQVQFQRPGGAWVSVDVNMGTTRVFGKRYEFGDPDCGDAAQWMDEPVPVVRSIVLPETQAGQPRKQFTFSYNSDAVDATNFSSHQSCWEGYTAVTSASHGWGSLSQIVTPLGATVNYSYGLDGEHYLYFNPDDAPREAMYRKTLTHDGTTDTWQYSVNPGGGSVANPDGSTVTETMYPHDPAFAHFAGVGGGVVGEFNGKEGLTYRTDNSGKVVTERHWRMLLFSGGTNVATGSVGLAQFNPVVDAEYTTLKEGGVAVKMSAKTFQYDYNGNVLQETDYDWFDPNSVQRDAQGVPVGVPSGAVVLRVTNSSYYNQATAANSGNVYAKRAVWATPTVVLTAPRETTAGASDTRFSYDAQPFDTAPTVGNLTRLSRWDDAGSRWLDTTNSYDSYGNLAATTDPRGNTTQFAYGDATHANLTATTSAVPDPTNQRGTNTPLVTSAAYDYYTGRVTSSTDANGQVNSYQYNDPVGRLTQVSLPDGGRTRYEYSDAAGDLYVKTLTDLDATRAVESRQYFDVLARRALVPLRRRDA